MLRNFLGDIRESVSDVSELCVIARRFPSLSSSANAIGYRIPILDEKNSPATRMLCSYQRHCINIRNVSSIFSDRKIVARHPRS